MEPEILRSPSSIKTFFPLIQIQRQNDRGELHGQIRPFQLLNLGLNIRSFLCIAFVI